MTALLTIFLLLFLTLLFISTIFIKKYKKLIDIKNHQIKELHKTIASLEAKIKRKERRQSFRARVENVTCEFLFYKIGGKKITPPKNLKGLGVVVDIGYLGMRFMYENEITIRKNVELEIMFQLENESFKLIGKLVRKEENLNNNYITYALQFMDVYTKEQRKLFGIIRKMEIKERRKDLA